jgi:hypothetical protein
MLTDWAAQRFQRGVVSDKSPHFSRKERARNGPPIAADGFDGVTLVIFVLSVRT